MSIRNPTYIDAEQRVIDIEFKHPTIGWIPMTITQQDYPDLWTEAIRMGVKIDKTLVDERQQLDLMFDRRNLSANRSQFVLKIRDLGVVDQQWAVQAAQGNLPVTLYDAIVAGGHQVSQDDAAIIWAGLNNIHRNHPFVEAIRIHKNLTPIQMDELFK